MCHSDPVPSTDELKACFEVSLSSGNAPLDITLDASCSTGDIVNNYEWEVSRINEPSVKQHLFGKFVKTTLEEPYVYTVTLKVIDGEKTQDTEAKEITVGEMKCEARVLQTSLSPQAKLKLKLGSGLSDSEKVAINKFKWTAVSEDEICETISPEYGEEAEIDFKETPEISCCAYTVTLELTDENGWQTSCDVFDKIEVRPEPPPIRFHPLEPIYAPGDTLAIKLDVNYKSSEERCEEVDIWVALEVPESTSETVHEQPFFFLNPQKEWRKKPQFYKPYQRSPIKINNEEVYSYYFQEDNMPPPGVYVFYAGLVQRGKNPLEDIFGMCSEHATETTVVIDRKVGQ